VNLLFKEDATKNEKLLASSLYLAFGFMLIGMFSRTLVPEEILIIFGCIGGIYSLIILSIIYYYLSIKNSQLRKNMESSFKRLWYVVFLFLFVVPMLSYISFAIGIPATLHFISSNDGEITVTVRKTTANYMGKHCVGGVYIKEYKYFLNDQICGIKRGDWDSLKPGNKIRLIGKKSLFGFTFEKYQKLTSRSS
jgi:hypothetical protein